MRGDSRSRPSSTWRLRVSRPVDDGGFVASATEFFIPGSHFAPPIGGSQGILGVLRARGIRIRFLIAVPPTEPRPPALLPILATVSADICAAKRAFS